MRRSLTLALLPVTCSLAACGSTNSDGAGSAGSAGMAGAAGAPGTAGMAGVAGSGSSDFDAANTCPVGKSCGRSFAQLVEGSSQYIDEPGTICVLEALRDRTPGLYLHETDSTWSNGSAGSKHALVVSPSGEVAYARRTYGYPELPTSDLSGMRCTLRSAAFFQDCIDAFTGSAPDSQKAWTCVYPGSTTESANVDWFESCAPESPLQCE